MTQQPQQPNRYARSQPSRYFPTSAEERNYRQIRVRQDTDENWRAADPVLAAGEFAYTIAPVTALEPPLPDQCIKVGDGNARWSQLPYLGGRGPQGPQGEQGDGVRIVGLLTSCGPPTVDQAPDPQIGDVWIVSCEDRTGSSDCMQAGCDGTAWAWDGNQWLFIGSVQGPPGNNVEYYYQEFAATAGQTEFQLDSEVQVQATFVTINGVILLPNDYTFEANADGDVLKFLNDIPLKDEDIIMVFSFKGAIDAAVRTLTTADISTLGVRPTNAPAVPREGIRNQQQVNWYLMDAVDNLEETVGGTLEDYATEEWVTEQIENIDIPSIDGLASQEWVLDQSYITEQVVTDAVSDQAQTQETIDGAQDTKITTLENKVDALEGTVVEAQFKADARDNPNLGGFVLKTIGNEKTNLFTQASAIILSTTDFTNKPISAESILNGDLVRLVMSPTNYATYKVTGSYVRNDEITIEVEYGTSGSEDFVFDGAVYDFTHTTPFDVGSAATKQYVDAQDEVTLNAANSYADQAIAGIDIPEVSTDGLMTTTGENICASQWKVRAPAQGGGNWTYISLAGTVGELALNHLRNPSERHHATNKGWVEDQAYVSTDSESPLVNQTITWNSSVSDTTPKMLFSSTEEYSPQSTEKMLLAGNYKSNGGSSSTWSFGYNTAGNYWNYDWAFGSNLTCRYVMGDQNKCVMSIDKTGVDMPSAYIVGDYSLEGVAEEDVEAVKAQAREIDIGHRLRELKKILVNLKTALKTKSADTQQALLDVLENVEDI